MVNLQRVASRYLKLSRDTSLWRSKCFDKSPCATITTSTVDSDFLVLQSQTHQGTADDTQENNQDPSPNVGNVERRSGLSGYARAIASWDRSEQFEKVDWYSEYVARHATLTATWLDERLSPPQEVRGLAVSSDSTKALGPLGDGGLCIWDISQTAAGRLRGHRTFHQLARTAPGVLFEDSTRLSESSDNKARLAFSGVGECVAIDSSQQKAYVAVADILNEIDLETLRVISQNKYAWPITALSQDDTPDRPLTVGTSWSLHLHDPRVNFRARSQSPEDTAKAAHSNPEDSIAFLPNYAKGSFPPGFEQPPNPESTTANAFSTPSTANASLPGSLLRNPSNPFGVPHHAPYAQFRPTHFGRSPFSNIGSVPAPRARRISRRSTLSDYAQIEPGPLSIVHQGQDNIFISGRFPSILSYDRRYFPRLQYVIHSGARLSALATIPYAPCRATDNTAFEATLLACGEYNGIGSLELYSLPHVKQSVGDVSSISRPQNDFSVTETESLPTEACQALGGDSTEPFSYKNRQAASRAKLLSVAAQGTRIVFSDAEGGLKWVERDGYGLVRRWNVNNFEMQGNGAGIEGDQVVRKIIPIAPPDSERGARGDGDLVVWTGEKVGVITTQRPRNEVDEMTNAFQETLGGDNDDDEKAEEYARAMRRALERQADERRWMSRFNMRYR